MGHKEEYLLGFSGVALLYISFFIQRIVAAIEPQSREGTKIHEGFVALGVLRAFVVQKKI